MYSDKDVLLGWVNTDESVQNSAALPTTAVMATFERRPGSSCGTRRPTRTSTRSATWAETDAFVRYFAGATWMEYLTGSGQLRPDQVDGTYDGTPANFVAAQGKDAQQGFATDEPFVYQNQLPSWNKPVDYQLIADTGYPLYAVALSVRTEDVTKQADCLKKLVPVVQQATVDYFADPATANALVVKAVTEFNTGWVYDTAARPRDGDEAADRPRHRGQQHRTARSAASRRPGSRRSWTSATPILDEGRLRPGRGPEGDGPVHQRVPGPDDRPPVTHPRNVRARGATGPTSADVAVCGRVLR